MRWIRRLPGSTGSTRFPAHNRTVSRRHPPCSSRLQVAADVGEQPRNRSGDFVEWPCRRGRRLGKVRVAARFLAGHQPAGVGSELQALIQRRHGLGATSPARTGSRSALHVAPARQHRLHRLPPNLVDACQSTPERIALPPIDLSSIWPALRHSPRPSLPAFGDRLFLVNCLTQGVGEKLGSKKAPPPRRPWPNASSDIA